MSSFNPERLIRRAANRCGVEIHRHRPEASEAGRLSAMLAHHHVDLVLDVGANTGQFACKLREAGYAGRVVSFEPLSQAHAMLVSASQRDARWDVAPRIAIGDHEGEIDIHVAGNSVSSSALGMLDKHIAAAPDSAYVGTERVGLSRLDCLAPAYMGTETNVFLKIDTQGYEDRVLDGATDLVSRIAGLQIEMSLVPLYAGQCLYDDLMRRLSASGFSIWAMWPGLCDPVNGRMLQVDVALFRD